MHTVKALLLTVSLLGISMVGALAYGRPERVPAPCAPVVTQHQRGARGQYDGRRNDSRWYTVRGTVRGADRPCEQAQPRHHATDGQCGHHQAVAPRWQHAVPTERQARRQQWQQRWQHASPAERQAMQARRQQWHQRWQSASPAERQAMQARWHHRR